MKDEEQPAPKPQPSSPPPRPPRGSAIATGLGGDDDDDPNQEPKPIKLPAKPSVAPVIKLPALPPGGVTATASCKLKPRPWWKFW